jgi:colanic acid/amylovoran biosynthesis glycosyltransferase
VHAHFGYDGLVAIHLARRLKVPLITTLHAQDIAPYNLRWSYRKSLGRLFNKVDLFIVVSEYIKSRAIAWGCPKDKIRLHFTGIDPHRFNGMEEKFKTPTILFVGRLINKKGCEYAIRAMSEVKKKFTDAELLIIGDGFLKPHLEALAAELNVNARFLGPKKPEEVATIMKKSWVYCGPSIVDDGGCSEGLPTVFLEAQAAALPIAGFDAGGVSESVIAGSTALLCDQKDHVRLGENIIYFLNCENRRREFGEAGKKLVNERFNLNKQVVELEKIYDEVIKNHTTNNHHKS